MQDMIIKQSLITKREVHQTAIINYKGGKIAGRTRSKFRRDMKDEM
jgi:hypothetical protein